VPALSASSLEALRFGEAAPAASGGLTTIGSALQLQGNPQLADCTGLEALQVGPALI
jgi:hypothetical protein